MRSLTCQHFRTHEAEAAVMVWQGVGNIVVDLAPSIWPTTSKTQLAKPPARLQGRLNPACNE